MDAVVDTRVQGIFCGVICSGICLDEGLRRISLRMRRVENILTACHTELDHPPLQNTEGNQYKGDKRCCLDKIHRDFAGRGKLAAFN